MGEGGPKPRARRTAWELTGSQGPKVARESPRRLPPPLNYIEDRVATQGTISLEAQDPIRYLVQTKTVLQYKIGVKSGWRGGACGK